MDKGAAPALMRLERSTCVTCAVERVNSADPSAFLEYLSVYFGLDLEKSMDGESLWHRSVNNGNLPFSRTGSTAYDGICATGFGNIRLSR